MLNGQRFQFTERTDSLGRSSIMPYLPLKLTNGGISIEVMALLDTGASVNGSSMYVFIGTSQLLRFAQEKNEMVPRYQQPNAPSQLSERITSINGRLRSALTFPVERCDQSLNHECDRKFYGSIHAKLSD